MFDWYVFGLEADDVDVFVGSTPQSWTASFPPWKATQTQRERKDRLPVASFFRGELLNFGFHRGKWRYYCTRFPEGEITPSMPLPTGNMTGFAWPRCKSKKVPNIFSPKWRWNPWWCTMVYKQNHSKSYGTTIFLIHSDSSFPSKKNIWKSLPILKGRIGCLQNFQTRPKFIK